MKFILVTAFALCFSINAECQKSNVRFGVYEGTLNATIPSIWIVKRDSTFIFLSFEGKHVRYIDIGKWSVAGDGLIKFTFTDKASPILQKATYRYFAETKAPYDSVFIKGKLSSHSGVKIEKASVIVNGKYELLSDTNGYFTFVYPRTISLKDLTIIKNIDGYETTRLELNSTSNHHNIDVLMPEIDSISCSKIYNSNLLMQSVLYKNESVIRYYNIPTKRMGYNSILFKTPDVSAVIQRLNRAKENQPQLFSNINQILQFLTK